MKNVRNHIALPVLVVVILSAMVILGTGAGAFESKSSNEKNVRLEIIPVQLVPDKPVTFKIQMTTHSVELNYDMVKLSILKDDTELEYQALKWNGSPPGGHHRSGVLEFPAIPKGTKSISLYIKNIADVPERVFEWKIDQ